MAEFHYLESFSASSLGSPPCLQYFEWIRTNVFLVTSRSEYLDPWKRSRVPMINALYKVPWNNAVADDCTEWSVVHTRTYTDTQLHSLEMVVNRGAPVCSLDVDHGRHWYSNRVTYGPSLYSPPAVPHSSCFPKEICPSLSTMCYIFTHTGFVGHNQAITSLRAPCRMTDFHLAQHSQWISSIKKKKPSSFNCSCFSFYFPVSHQRIN